MSLEEIDLPAWKASQVAEPSMDHRLRRLLSDAEHRIADLFAKGCRRRMPRFVPADADPVFAALEHITRLDLPVGRIFCEWGSGIGVFTCMASRLGYQAYGIEIEPELGTIARQLANAHEIDATFLDQSYFPEGYECFAGTGTTELLTPEMALGSDRTDSMPVRYEGMPFDTDEIDVFYVYPWPGEQEMMLELFNALASDGAILLSYHGDGEVAACQKSAASW